MTYYGPPALKSRAGPARAEAIRQLVGIADPSVCEIVLRGLRDRAGVVRVAAQNAYTLWAVRQLFNDELPLALGTTLQNLAHKQARVRTAALQTLAAFVQRGLMSPETLYAEITRVRTPLQDRFLLYHLAPETFTGKPEQRILEAIHRDVLNAACRSSKCTFDAGW